MAEAQRFKSDTIHYNSNGTTHDLHYPSTFFTYSHLLRNGRRCDYRSNDGLNLDNRQIVTK